MSIERAFWYFIAQKIRPFLDVDMDGKKIGGLPTSGFPTQNDEVATKIYVDGLAGAGGDMLKSVYDVNKNNIVDNAEKLEGSNLSTVRTHTPQSHALDAHSVPTSDLNMNSKKITAVQDPINDQEAATKAYVDSLV